MSGSVSTQTIEQVDIFAGFEQIVRHQPDRIAFKADGGKGESYTYGEILQTSRQIANNLRAEGIASDTSGIGLIGENCPEWPIAYLSILAAGQTVIPIDSSLKAEEIAQIVRHSGIKAAFCSGRLESRLRIAADGLTIFSFESDSKDSWKRLFQDTAIEPERQTCRTAAVIYTSGTTGAPKAVELTHKNIMSNVNGLRKVLCLDQSDVFLSILPLHHTFEATCGFLLPLLLGSTIVYARSFKSKEILEDIAKNKITTMIGVPLLFEKMHHSFKRKIASASWVQRFMFRFLYGLSAIGWRFGWKWGRGLFRSFRKRAGLGSIR
ncbi:MAG: AMP-binding protein, partial [candidate division Zixibacteria bacterium]|nr:AMP-binding protein [candidate division Zixibacteria bacterium]